MLPSVDGPPDRLVLLGGDSSLLAEARETGMARTVLGELPASGTVDAIAVLSRARPGVAEATARLAPDGAIYWEVDRLRHPGWAPSVLRSKLERCGVQVQDVYWVGPGFSGASAYVSLATVHPFAWYVRAVLVPRTWARSVGINVLRGLAGGRPERLQRVAPRYALVAGRRDPARPAPVVFDLRQGLANRPPGRRHGIMLVGGQGDWSRVTLLPFDAHGRQPALVLKAARRPAFTASLDREQRALAEVRARLGPDLRDSVPEPLGSRVWNGAAVGVESFVLGRSMGISLADRHSGWDEKLGDLRAAAEWLAEMHTRSLAGRDPWNLASRTRMVDTPLQRYASVFGLREREDRLFQETLRASGALEGMPFPRVRWHRDFQPTNIFRDGDAIRVVDWEVSTEGPALIDLVYFLVHWAWRASGARNEVARRDVFRELFVDFGGGRLALAARGEIARYLERLAIDPRFVSIFVLVTMVELALDHSTRMKDLDRPDWNSRDANPHAAYVGLLAGSP